MDIRGLAVNGQEDVETLLAGGPAHGQMIRVDQSTVELQIPCMVNMPDIIDTDLDWVLPVTKVEIHTYIRHWLAFKWGRVEWQYMVYVHSQMNYTNILETVHLSDLYVERVLLPVPLIESLVPDARKVVLENN